MRSQIYSNFYRGVCTSREKSLGIPGAPPEEEYVYKSECRLRLDEVDFETFQGAIKRFGYRIDLNDEHMKSISREIKLNVTDMNENKNSPFAIAYKDDKFFFLNKRHNVPKLLKLGFLLCKHYSPDAQALEFWHLINPKLDERISKQHVVEFLSELAYVATDMNLSKILV